MSDNEDREQSIADSATIESGTSVGEDASVEVCVDVDLLRSLNEMVSSLCSACRECARGQIQGDGYVWYHVYHPSLSSLQESVDAGCRICKDLSQSLDKYCKGPQSLATPTQPWSIRCRLSPLWRGMGGTHREAFELRFFIWESDCLDIVEKFDNSYEGLTFATMKFFPADWVSLGPEFLDPSLETSTAKSTISMNLARNWYQQCLSHSTCRNWREDSRSLPTRLVRIWRPDNTSPDLISAKLCETRHLPLSTAYITLSHRWGENQIFQLRQSNIEKLRQSIPFNELPQVFQDAIYISIELGVTYIWIDSLCIIQDSKDDWVYEARRMGHVYQYAACNLAAAGYDSSRGLFTQRKAMSQEHPPLSAEWIPKYFRSPMGPYEGLYVRADEHAFLQKVTGSSLNSRAWVAQERALSPGIIHITPEMMWWECNNLIANEAFPMGVIQLDIEEPVKLCTIRRLTAECSPEQIYAFWRKFIGLYAGLDLTYEQDRFPAALGIARTLSGLINDNFIAGFWEGDLIRSLIMIRRGQMKDVPAIQSAPSWSWASFRADHLSAFWYYDAQPLSGVSIRVLSDVPGFKSDLESTSLEISDVRGLEITAPLRTLSVDIEAGHTSAVLRKKHGTHDGWSEWFDETRIERDIPDESDPSAINIPENQAWRLRAPTHVLILARQYNYPDDFPTNMACALLVQQVREAEGCNAFRRLGVGFFGFRKEKTLEEYLGLHREEGDYLPSPVFGGCGFQTIVLI